MKIALRIDWPWLGARLRAALAAAPDWPLVSLGLAVPLALVLLVVQLGYAHRLEAAHAEVAAVVDFAIHHPAVQVPTRLVPAVQALVPSFDGNETFAFLRQAGARRAQHQSEQQEFDALADVALGRVDSHPQRRLGLLPAQPRISGFLGYFLVHAGWLHGLATLALLLLLGPLLERTWGWKPLLALLPAAVVLGGVGFAAAHAGSERPLLGASVVVSALAAGALVRFWKQDVDPLHWLPAELSIRAPFWVLGAAWLGYEALLWRSVPGGLPGGFDAAQPLAADLPAAAAGALAALAVRHWGLEVRSGASAPVLGQRRRAPRFDFERVLAMRASGRADKAYALLQAEVERSARNRDAVVTFFQMSVERGRAQRALPAMRQLIAEELRRGAAEIAVSHWRTLCEHVDDTGIAPDVLVSLVPALLAEDDPAMALIALRKAYAQPLTPALARSIAELAAPLEPALAADAARRALEAEGLHPDERARLERLLAAGARRRDPAPAAGLELEPEEPVEEVKPRQPPPLNVFYAEQDRTLFGVTGELTQPGDEDRLYPTAPAASAPLDVTEVVPLGLDASALLVERSGRGRARIPFARVHAVATVGVRGLGPRPVVLIDLLVGGEPGGPPARVVRLRSDRFDPRPFAVEADSPLAALRAFAAELARRAGGELLPPGVEGSPLRTFASVADYEREVLGPL